jgi:hypothetical protein
MIRPNGRYLVEPAPEGSRVTLNPHPEVRGMGRLAVVACTVAPLPPTPPAVTPGPTTVPSTESGCARAEEAADVERSNTYVDPHPLELDTASPEDVGLDPALLEVGAENAGQSKAIASMLVIRHGKLVFEVSTIGVSEIVIVGIADGSRTTMTRDVVPIWSPDGDWIVFGRS